MSGFQATGDSRRNDVDPWVIDSSGSSGDMRCSA